MGRKELLREDRALFYHPLDDNLQEYMTKDIWTGTAFPVPGRIGEGDSGFATNETSLGPLQNIASGNSDWQNAGLSIVILSPTKMVASYGIRSEPAFAKVGTIIGSGITWGNPTIFRESKSDAHVPNQQQEMRFLDSTHVAISYSLHSPVGGYVKIGTVSGTSIVFGSGYKFVGRADGDIRMTVLDSTHIALLYREGMFTGTTHSILGTISGTTVTFGPAEEFTPIYDRAGSLFNSAIVTLDTNRVVGASLFGEVAKVGTVSGTSIVWGSGNQLPPVQISPLEKSIQLTTIDNSRVMFNHYVAPTYQYRDGISPISIMTIDGDNITFGQSVQPQRTERHVWMTLLDSSTMLLNYRAKDAQPYTDHSRLVLTKISGVNISLGSSFKYGSNVTTDNISAKISNSKFIVGLVDLYAPSGTGSARYLIGSPASSGNSDITDTSGIYTPAIGNTKFVACMWGRNLVAPGSEIIISRGYDVVLNNNYVAFGTNGAKWYGVDIDTLTTTLNDGSDHFLVVDFTNVSGTLWSLKTSIDGNGFISHGTQTSGNQIIISTDTQPRLRIINGIGVSQWIDELVVWSAPKNMLSSFVNKHLANLYNLSVVHNATMDEYGNIFMNINPSIKPILLSRGSSNAINKLTKTFTVSKLLRLTPKSTKTPTQIKHNFFFKDTPSNIKIIGCNITPYTLNKTVFDGDNGYIRINILSSSSKDKYARPTNDIKWDTVVSNINCKDVDVDKSCFNTYVKDLNALNDNFTTINKGGSLQVVVDAQVENDYSGSGSLIEIFVSIECMQV